MKIGEKIRYIRILKGYSQENMAEMLGISTTGYSKIERGETDISFSRLEQIAKALDISVIDLLSFQDKYYVQQTNHTGNYGGFIVNQNIYDAKLEDKVKEIELEVAKIKEELQKYFSEILSNIMNKK